MATRCLRLLLHCSLPELATERSSQPRMTVPPLQSVSCAAMPSSLPPSLGPSPHINPSGLAASREQQPTEVDDAVLSVHSIVITPLTVVLPPALPSSPQDLRRCREQQSAEVDDAILTAPPETPDKWKAAAMSAVDALMLSDAPLQHPPGQTCGLGRRRGRRMVQPLWST